ncbi:MAG: hypothetical protein Q4A08_09700 [Bacteroidales bacterium]|nr:hypothetical protein [Bacteroidales bacterium]
MARKYNTKSRGLAPIDGYPELSPAYGPWKSTDECEAFWKDELFLDDVPLGATCAILADDGSITKHHYEKHNGVGVWVKEGSGVIEWNQ